MEHRFAVEKISVSRSPTDERGGGGGGGGGGVGVSVCMNGGRGAGTF